MLYLSQVLIVKLSHLTKLLPKVYSLGISRNMAFVMFLCFVVDLEHYA